MQGSRDPEGPPLSRLFSSSSPLLPPSQGETEKERNVCLSSWEMEETVWARCHGRRWEIEETGVGDGGNFPQLPGGGTKKRTGPQHPSVASSRSATILVKMWLFSVVIKWQIAAWICRAHTELCFLNQRSYNSSYPRAAQPREESLHTHLCTLISSHSMCGSKLTFWFDSH